MINPPILAHFSDTKPIKLYTDGSNQGLGAVLTQVNELGQEQAVGFLSRKIRGSEIRYTATELEIFAICYALQSWRSLLLGRHIDVYTDHRALESIKNTPRINTRLTKFQLIMSDFDVTIHYTPGKKHLMPDALSRNPIGDYLDKNYEDRVLFTAMISLTEIKDAQLTDPFCSSMIKIIKSQDATDKKLYRQSRRFLIDDDVLYYKAMDNNRRLKKLVIPTDLQNEILRLYHDSPSTGHLGFKKTLTRIQERFYWPNLFTQVKDYVRTCDSCQRVNVPTRAKYGLLKSVEVASKPFEKISMDFLEGLPSSQGYTNILVMVDSNSRFALAFPTRNLTAETVAKHVLKVSFMFGVPKVIISDRGTAFTSQLNQALETAFDIKHNFTTSYRPQSNGLCEKINSIILKMLAHFVRENDKQWSQFLDPIIFAYNTSKLTNLPYSPAELLFGYQPNQPPDILLTQQDTDLTLKDRLQKINLIRRQVPELMKSLQEKQKFTYDQHRIGVDFQPGDLVLIERPRTNQYGYYKFQPRFVGPYKILEKQSENNYIVEFVHKNKLTKDSFHVSKLKSYHRRPVAGISQNDN